MLFFCPQNSLLTFAQLRRFHYWLYSTEVPKTHRKGNEFFQSVFSTQELSEAPILDLNEN